MFESEKKAENFVRPEKRATEMFLNDSLMAIHDNEDYLDEHEEIVRYPFKNFLHVSMIVSSLIDFNSKNNKNVILILIYSEHLI